MYRSRRERLEWRLNPDWPDGCVNQVSAAGQLANAAILVGRMLLIVPGVVVALKHRKLHVLMHGWCVLGMWCARVCQMALACHRLHADRSRQHIAA